MRDLSHPIVAGMPVYPGDPAVRVEPALELAADGVAVARLRLGSHSGTHLDAPAHTVPGGRTTGAIHLDELVGEALVVHLADGAPLAPGTRIGRPEIEAALDGGLPDTVPPIVVLDTGWAGRFDGDDATGHPFLDPAAARELVRRGMRILAVDTLSPDPTGSAADGGAAVTGFPVHDAVLGADRLIVENLTNLVGLPERVRIGFFPLPIDADGAPVRAVAFDAAPDVF